MDPWSPPRLWRAWSVDALAALGLLALVVAGVGTMAPTRSDTAGLAPWAWLMVAVHLGILVAQFTRPWPPPFSGRTVGLAGILYWYLAEGLQTGASYPEFTSDHVLFSLALVQLYAVAFLIGYRVRAHLPTIESSLLLRMTPQAGHATALTTAVLLGGLAGLAPMFLLGSGDLRGTVEDVLMSRRANVGWGRGNLGDERSVVLSLNYFGWGAACLAAVVWLRRDAKPVHQALAAAVWIIMALLLFFRGTRHLLAVVALPPLGMIAALTPPKARVRLGLIMGLGLLTLYAAFQIQEYARTRGFLAVEQDELVERLWEPRGHQYLNELLWVSQVVPENMSYSTPGTALFHVLINPVPRAMWPGKPVDPFWRDYSAFRAGSDVMTGGTTIAPGHIGQWYAEGGWPMVIVLGLFMGAWAALGDAMLAAGLAGRYEALCLGTLLITLMLLGYRGINAGVLYVAPAVILLLGLSSLISRVLGLRPALTPPAPVASYAGQ